MEMFASNALLATALLVRAMERLVTSASLPILSAPASPATRSATPSTAAPASKAVPSTALSACRITAIQPSRVCAFWSAKWLAAQPAPATRNA